MYRTLDAEAPVRERRDQLRHPEYDKPELVATRPNQVWSRDITKLLGPRRWTYYLYVLLDIYSRYAVGWMLADRENSMLASQPTTGASQIRRFAMHVLPRGSRKIRHFGPAAPSSVHGAYTASSCSSGGALAGSAACLSSPGCESADPRPSA